MIKFVSGGKFLERTRIAKPNCDPENPVCLLLLKIYKLFLDSILKFFLNYCVFYGIGDFAIGATIFVLKHRFIITNADEYVLKYLEANESQYPKETIESLRNGLVKKI